MAARGHEVALACRAGGILEGRARGPRASTCTPFPFRGDWSPSAALGLARLARRVRPRRGARPRSARARRRAGGATRRAWPAAASTSRSRAAASRWKYGRCRRVIAVSAAVAAVLRRDGVAPERVRVVYEGVPDRAAGAGRTGHAGRARRADDGAGGRQRRRAHRSQGPSRRCSRPRPRVAARVPGGPLRDRGRRRAQGRAPRPGGRARAAGPRGLRRLPRGSRPADPRLRRLLPVLEDGGAGDEPARRDVLRAPGGRDGRGRDPGGGRGRRHRARGPGAGSGRAGGGAGRRPWRIRPARERMGAAGRRRFESRFSADRMVDATLAVYGELR